jgi:hypothetical protein
MPCRAGAAQVNVFAARSVFAGGSAYWGYQSYSVGTVWGYRPPPVVFGATAVGVVNPYPVVQPVTPVISLQPTIYAPAYLNLLTPGYQTIVAQNVAYYYYPTLPPAATVAMIGGITYYQAGGVWFQPFFTGGRSLFLVVPPPF